MFATIFTSWRTSKFMAKDLHSISKTDKIAYYDYIVRFEDELSHFVFDWSDASIQNFLAENKISSHEGSGKFWISLVAGHKNKDKGYSILKRIRNSMAHGHIKKGRKYYYIQDYTSNGTKTMDCKIPVKTLWKLIELVINTRYSNSGQQ